MNKFQRTTGIEYPLAFFMVAPIVHLWILQYFTLFKEDGESALFTGLYYSLLVMWIIVSGKLLSMRHGYYIYAVDKLFLILLLLIALSVAFYGGNRWVNYVPFFMVAPYLGGRLLNKSKLKKFLHLLLVLLLVIVFMVQYDLFNSILLTPGGRPMVFGFDHGGGVASNAIGLLLVLLMGFVTKSKDSYRKNLYGWSSVLVIPWLIFLLVYLQFRSALYAALLVSFLLTLFSNISRSRRIAIIFYLLISTAVAMGIVFQDAAKFNISPIFEVAQPVDRPVIVQVRHLKVAGVGDSDLAWSQASSVEQRVVLLLIAVQQFLSHPFFGIGAGRFAEVTDIPGAYPHNSVLQALCELGVIGGAIYISITLNVISRIFRLVLCRTNAVIEAVRPLLGLWIYLFCIELLSGNFLMSSSFWLVTGLAVTVLRDDFVSI